MVPANQRLGAGQPVVRDAIFRLQVNDELPFSQGRLHPIRHGLFPPQLIAKLVIVSGKIFAILPFDASGGQQRPIAHLLHRNRAVLDGINSPFHDNVLCAGQGVHPYAGLHEHLVRILDAAFEQAGELIRVEPPADPPLPDKRCIHVRQAAKEPVPRRNTEYIVNQLEVLHIRTNDIILPVRMMQQNLLDPLIKELLAVQPRQSIILNQPNHGGGFPQMDNAGYPM